MIDAKEIDRLAYDLGEIPDRVVKKVRPVVSKGALNIKNQLQREAKASEHFAPLSRSIGYEMTDDADGVSAEVGPDPERSGSAGLLGAYWGWSRGGGDSLPDPLLALEAEEPRFVQSLAEVAGYVFD